MNPLIEKIRLQFEARKELFLWILFLIVGAVAAMIASDKSKEATPANEVSSLETFIPRDHLLIPVEIVNADKLDGILGSNGIVDLYQTGVNGAPARLVGRRLRLLRAPMNPQSFAVLLKDQEADRFLASGGPYLASVRPLQESTHEVSRTKQGPRIDYHQESL